MMMNYKKYLIIIISIIFLCIGCSNNNLEKKTKDFVVNNSYDIVYRDLNSLINEIQMFPTKDSEEEFIYYIEAIKENYTKFNNNELNSFVNLLDKIGRAHV